MRDFTELISQMTLDEKVGQLIQLSAVFFGTDSELTGPAQQWGLTEEQMATIGSCIGGADAATIRKVQEDHLAKDRNKIPMIFMFDVIHGYRTIYPINLGLAGSFDPDLVSECTKMAAKEASAGGFHLTFAPMVDLVRDPRWGRVMESCGEDPHLASVMGVAQVKAYQGDDVSAHSNIAACVKHFAAYGAVESGKDYNCAELSEHTLRQFYLPSYKACIDAGVKMLMPSFNTVNGIPSTANSFLMKKILKDEWGYDGVIISDWAALCELCTHGVAENLKEAARLGFENGCHIEMLSQTYYRHLAELVREGTIKESDVDKAVLYVLRLKDELGLFDDPFHGADDARGQMMYLSEEHRKIARRAAEESAVLLKNNGVLPFSTDAKRIAIIGPYATEKEIQGKWSARGTAEECVSVYEGISTLLPNAEILTAKGCGNLFTDTDTSGIDEAVDIARQADAVILCVGEPLNYSGEANSRSDIRLPGAQAELIKAVSSANPNSAVVLFNGRPLELTNIYNSAPAILEMWFPGSEGGNAVANLLFGASNPCGKLAMSFPKSVGQLPLYYNRTRTGRPRTKSEDVYQPFSSSYLDCGNLPLFFFGEGHSYTDFTYEKMSLSSTEMADDDTLTLTVTLKNSGSRAGKEVVQIYLRDHFASTARPIQELIAFKKVYLEPGETQDLRFEIREPMLRFWNAENQYVSEAGAFTLSVGYADHMALSQDFRLIKK